MTVSSTNTIRQFNGDGSTAAFAYNFKVFADADLQVIVRSATGVESVKTSGSHYNASGIGETSGGTVTFTSGNIPASGETITLRRAKTIAQELDLVANDPFPAASLEDQLDKLTHLILQNNEELDRALKLSRTNTMTSTEFTQSATDRANKVLSFDSSGEIAVTQELGVYRGNWAASTAYNQRDLVKDTSTAGANSIYICVTAHTSSGSAPIATNTDAAKWSILVDRLTTAVTTTTSLTNDALVVGRDADNQVKFSTDNQIIFRVSGGDGVTFKASGEIEATSLDISGVAAIDGLTTFGAGFNVGSDASGDILYNDGSKYVRLAKGTDGQTLTLASGLPAWATNAGDIAGVTAGVGLSGGGTSGTVSLALDLSELSDVTPVNGDKLATLDSDGSTEQLTTVASLATLFAGTGLTASSSVIGIDAAQTAITSLLATDIKIGEDDQTKIDFETADEIHFYANNVSLLSLTNANSGDAVLTVPTADKNFTIKGTDGSSSVTPLDIDMADAGKATFGGNVVVTGDLTITGDDLFMNTNTSGHMLVADGTNYNPVAISGDVTMAASGAVTIANDAVEQAMIADNAVSLAKMAGLARGKIIYGDSSGNPAALAAGTDGYYLKSDGTDISWAAVSAGATAADDIGTGDAAVTIATSTGNITLDAQGNDTDIIFKGTDGSADTRFLTLDGSEAGTASFNNHILAPNQSAFLATPSGTQSNFSVGSAVDVAFATEVFDQNADFSTPSFTAPVTGRYFLATSVDLEAIDSASAYYSIQIITSNRNYITIFDPDFGQDAVYWTVSLSVLADMDASDTAKVVVTQANGTAQTDIIPTSHFSGHLVC